MLLQYILNVYAMLWYFKLLLLLLYCMLFHNYEHDFVSMFNGHISLVKIVSFPQSKVLYSVIWLFLFAFDHDYILIILPNRGVTSFLSRVGEHRNFPHL